MKRARKYSAVSVYDYPRCCYSAYWQIQIDQNEEGWVWSAQVINYEASKVINAEVGQEAFKTEDEARTASQDWVKSVMPEYRRAKPIRMKGKEVVEFDDLTDAEINAMVAEFDLSRSRAEYAKCDIIRGMLNAFGIKTNEKQSIGYSGRTTWSREGA